jgi:hypothetical protein
MEVSGQIHAVAALPQEKYRVLTAYEIEWFAEPA